MLPSLVPLALAVLSPGHLIMGRVLDCEGQPVGGARLWLSSQEAVPTGPQWELVASATSTDTGGFELTIPTEWIERAGVLCDLSVLVWKEGHGAFRASWAPDDVPAGVPFEPWLPELRSTEFTVEDPSGTPYRGVRVFPTALTYPDSGSGLRISPEIWSDACLFRTDGEGRVTLPFASEAIVELIIALPESGRFGLTWMDRSAGDFPGTLVLPRPTERAISGPDAGAATIEAGTRTSLRAWLQVPSFEARTLTAEFHDVLELKGDGPWTASVPDHLGQLLLRPEGEGVLPASLAGTRPGASSWIHGRAMNEDGSAAAGAWITAARRGEARQFRVLTAVAGPDGSFRVGPVVPEDPFELIGHRGGRIGRVGVTAPRDGSAVKPAKLKLAPAPCARVESVWQGDEPAPRLRLTLVGEDALTYVNVEGALIVGGSLSRASGADEAIVLERALAPGGLYAIRFEGWSDADRRRVLPGMTAFLPAEELAAGITLPAIERWITPELTASGVDIVDQGELRVRLRTSEFWSPVESDGTFTALGGESDSDIVLFERDGLIEAAILGQNLRTAESSDVDLEAHELTAARPSRAEDADTLLVKKLAWSRVTESLAADPKSVVQWLEPLMHADPDGVLAFLDSGVCEDPTISSRALSMLAARVAIRRPGEALALVGREEIARSRARIAYRAAPYLEKPAAWEALSRASAEVPEDSDASGQVLRAAFIARGLVELGEGEAARTVWEPAIETAKKLAKSGRSTFDAAELGAVVFLENREVGLELVVSARQDSDRHRAIARAAAWLAKVDIEASEEMLASLKGEHVQFYIDRALPAIVYHMAESDARRASEIADRYATSGIPYGLIALALAERGSRDEAIEALLRAFDRLDEDARASYVRRHHPVAVAAFLMGIADVVDPAGFEGWQVRALGVPRHSGGYTSFDAEALANAEACLAIALSGHSPPIAQAILEPWIVALASDGPRTRGARSQIHTIGTALALIHRENLEARLEDLPGDLRDLALRAGVSALARSSDPIGRLFPSCKLLPASWWPGEEGL
ncbi:hypothetical protein Poly30_19570 [Planctomycetes bacterium Poly30]|uniref:Uncharacterized protein n=1 Tax=Saltatorellus ferox TaxID=2528018 RepID=A0A518EQT2_9BACT|nr:hypothetical protein Poly30_19570 [Planctomycetes bacterium Poly30]